MRLLTYYRMGKLYGARANKEGPNILWNHQDYEDTIESKLSRIAFANGYRKEIGFWGYMLWG